MGKGKQPVLALDLDGVCADYVQGMRQHLDLSGHQGALGLPEPDVYNFHEATGWPFTSLEDFVSAHRSGVEAGIYGDLPLIEGAVPALKSLSDDEVHIRVLTHRLFISGLHQRVVTDTVAWLDKNNIPYRSLCFAESKDSVDADLYIDDSPKNIEMLQGTGKNVIVFDQSYNRDVVAPRAHNWTEAEAMIRGRLLS